MGKSNRKYTPKNFESDNLADRGGDVSANLYRSMLESEPYQELTAKQKELYSYCKLQYYAQKKSEKKCFEHLGIEDLFDGRYFTFNRYKWKDKYQLYTESNQRGFYRDMSALIEKGFINCVHQGAIMKEKNLYELSARWKDYGTPNYKIPNNYKSVSLLGLRKQKT